jgi:hypothetical protein
MNDVPKERVRAPELSVRQIRWRRDLIKVIAKSRGCINRTVERCFVAGDVAGMENFIIGFRDETAGQYAELRKTVAEKDRLRRIVRKRYGGKIWF